MSKKGKETMFCNNCKEYGHIACNKGDEQSQKRECDCKEDLNGNCYFCGRDMSQEQNWRDVLLARANIKIDESEQVDEVLAWLIDETLVEAEKMSVARYRLRDKIKQEAFDKYDKLFDK